MSEKILGADLVIEDSGTVVLEKFEKKLDKTSKAIDKAAKTSEKLDKSMQKMANGSKVAERVLGNNFKSATDRAANGVSKLRNMVDRTAKRISNMEKKTIQAAQKMKSSFDKIPESLKKIGSAAGSVIGKVAKLGAGITAAAVVGTTAIGVGSIKAGAELEKYGVSMRHFIGVQNKGMSDAQVSKAAEGYVNNLREYAKLTPFEDADIMAGGNRMLQITGGNTTDAYKFLQIAGDMSALIPGKTVMDAVEALADAKMGEFERMKEFGVKVSAEEFKALVGKGKNDSLTDAETEKAFAMILETKVNNWVKGGAKKLSETATGRWSTATGTISSAFANLGLNTLEKMNKNGSMQKLVDLSERFANSIGGISDKIADLANKGFDWLLQKGDKVMGGLEKMMIGFGSDIEAMINGEKSFGDIMEGWIQKAETPIKNAISGTIDFLIGQLTKPENIERIAGGAIAIGKGIVTGVVDGVAGSIPGVKELSESSTKVKNWKSADDLYNSGLGYELKPQKKAVGGKIPYDNYPALLHEGEVVLTKQQVNQTKTTNNSPIVINNYFQKGTDEEKMMEIMVKKLNIVLGN